MHLLRSQSDEQTALRLYDQAIHQLAKDYYLLITLYIELHKHSETKKGRLAQSPILAMIASDAPLLSAISKEKLPALPTELVEACYACFRDEPACAQVPSCSEDARYLLVSSRGRWLSAPQLSEWMGEIDSCWPVHKPLLQLKLIKIFKIFKTTPPLAWCWPKIPLP